MVLGRASPCSELWAFLRVSIRCQLEKASPEGLGSCEGGSGLQNRQALQPPRERFLSLADDLGLQEKAIILLDREGKIGSAGNARIFTRSRISQA